MDCGPFTLAAVGHLIETCLNYSSVKTWEVFESPPGSNNYYVSGYFGVNHMIRISALFHADFQPNLFPLFPSPRAKEEDIIFFHSSADTPTNQMQQPLTTTGAKDSSDISLRIYCYFNYAPDDINWTPNPNNEINDLVQTIRNMVETEWYWMQRRQVVLFFAHEHANAETTMDATNATVYSFGVHYLWNELVMKNVLSYM